MAEDQAKPLSLTLDSVEYPLVMPDDMTMREQVEFERIADAGVDAIARLDDDWRAAVVMAWMAVSIHRTRPSTPMRQITDRLDLIKSAELVEIWGEIIEDEAAGQSPPQAGQSSDASSESETPTAEGSKKLSETEPAPMTPPGTGDPGSVSHLRRSAI